MKKTQESPIELNASLSAKEQEQIKHLAEVLSVIKPESRWAFLLKYHLLQNHQIKGCPTLMIMRGAIDFQIFACNTEGGVLCTKPVAIIKLSSF